MRCSWLLERGDRGTQCPEPAAYRLTLRCPHLDESHPVACEFHAARERAQPAYCRGDHPDCQPVLLRITALPERVR